MDRTTPAVAWRLDPRDYLETGHSVSISLETEDLTVTWTLNLPFITCRNRKCRVPRVTMPRGDRETVAPVLSPTVTWRLSTPILPPYAPSPLKFL